MNDLKTAAILALEALEGSIAITMAKIDLRNTAIKALEEALAKQEQGEPVGYVWQEWTKENSPYGIEQWVRKYDYFPPNSEIKQVREVTPLYTTPQPAQKPLTRDDLWKLWCKAKAESEYLFWWEFARAIEAAHGIKENT